MILFVIISNMQVFWKIMDYYSVLSPVFFFVFHVCADLFSGSRIL
jgi:hypothetical protein